MEQTLGQTFIKNPRKEDFKRGVLPQKEILKGIDFKKYRVVPPSELTTQPVTDREKAGSTSFGSSIEEEELAFSKET